jgi:hypothetical protein
MRALPLILPLFLLSACSYSLPDSTHSRSYAGGGAAAPAAEPQSTHDLEACRRSADREMGAESAIDPADDFTANPMVLARREQLRSQYQTLVDQCMGNPR